MTVGLWFQLFRRHARVAPFTPARSEWIMASRKNFESSGVTGIQWNDEIWKFGWILTVLVSGCDGSVHFFFTLQMQYTLERLELQWISDKIVKKWKRNLYITKPRYSEQIFSCPWPFVKSKFLCTCLVYYNSLNNKTSEQN